MSLYISNFKKYSFWVIALSCISMCIYILSSELLIRNVIYKYDNLNKHIRLYRTSSSRNAAFGDSHVANGFVGDVEFINLGYPGENIEEINYKIRRYFHDKRPEKIILQADPHMFARYRNIPVRADYLSLFGPEEGYSLDAIKSYYRGDLWRYWRSALWGDLKKNKTSFDGSGAQLRSDKADFDRAELARMAGSVMDHKPEPNFRYSNFARMYEGMLSYLKKQGGVVCMVTFPVSRAYLDEANRYDEFQLALQYFHGLADRYGVKYLSYYDKMANQPGLFANEDHLNSSGARILSLDILSGCFQNN